MKTLAVLKKDLEFNRGLASLLEALKNISVAQFRLLEQKIKIFEQFMNIVESFFDIADFSKVAHPFLVEQKKPQAVIAVTSDSGLLGGLNMQVVALALKELERIPGKLIVIGERGKIYAQETGTPFVAFPGINDEERHSQAMQMRDYVLDLVLGGAFGYLKVVFPRPVSFTVQRVEIFPFLPFTIPYKEGIRKNMISELILESHPADLVEYLVYLWIGQKLFEIFGLSRLAELAARFVHLEESSQKLKDLDAKTHLEYFRVRHELIDRNMRELFASRLMYHHS
ncbi:MAG: F0F1 ATP synthase subunit gamma [Candidatus Omnitrophica bacterium]|nr:F0F1 ATP synthase subunit gamma [Candidatus Omnitrophota bacterium]